MTDHFFYNIGVNVFNSPHSIDVEPTESLPDNEEILKETSNSLGTSLTARQAFIKIAVTSKTGPSPIDENNHQKTFVEQIQDARKYTQLSSTNTP